MTIIYFLCLSFIISVVGGFSVGTSYLYPIISNTVVWTSPHYPSGYNNSDDILRRYVAIRNYGFVLRFTDFHTEQCCDSLTLYSAGTSGFQDQVEVASLRGELTHLQPITIYQRYLLLHWSTNGAINYRGYEVEITTIPLPGRHYIIYFYYNILTPYYPCLSQV